MSHKCYMFFCFKQKTAYELRISDWSSDVCSSDLVEHNRFHLLIVSRSFYGVNDIAQAKFPQDRIAAGNKIERILRLRLLDDCAVQLKHQGAARDRCGAGGEGESGIKQTEEEQHAQKDEPVLDGHQNAPNTLYKAQPSTLSNC